MNQPEKYILRTKTISVEEAQAIRDRDMEQIQSEIDALLENLAAIKAHPLVLEQTYQEKVLPGHPDYDQKATFHFSPEHYIGDMTWTKG